MQIVEKAYAKVNISLKLTGQKHDNLHYLVSLICFSDFHDTIVIEDSNKFVYEINKDFKFIKPDLILRTIDSISREIGTNLSPFKITLKKELPIGAGLGGGSADSAAVIRGIDKFFNLKLSDDQKVKIGKEIGSDVPSCIFSKPLILSGYGENYRRLEGLKDKDIIIIYPNIKISTEEIFSLVDINIIEKKESYLLEQELEDSIDSYNSGDSYDNFFCNDLEKLTISKYPMIEKVKRILLNEGSSYVSMTGSGSSFFGFFQEELIDDAYEKILNLNYDWKVFRCKLMGSDY